MGWGISFPLHEVLLLLPLSEGLSLDDLFNLPFEGVFDDVGRGLEEVQAMFGGFLVGGKKGSMEHVVNLPHFR